jgi:uncharacterized Tic20 family protein
MSDPTNPTPSAPPAAPAPLNYASPLPEGYIEADPSMRTLAMLAHLLQFAGFFIGPLVLYLIKKDDPTTNAYAKGQMKEVLNWSFTVIIGMVISVILFIVIIGFFLYFALIITSLVYTILNAVKANKGEVAKYPWSIKFLK